MATRQVGFTSNSACGSSTLIEMLSVREICVKLEDGTTTLGYAVYLVTEEATTLLRIESEDGTILNGVTMNDSPCKCES